jgi:hypothetical protein
MHPVSEADHDHDTFICPPSQIDKSRIITTMILIGRDISLLIQTFTATKSHDQTFGFGCG